MTIQRNTAIVRGGQIQIDPRKLVISDQKQTPPEILVNREQDRIRSVEIRCSCGEHVILDCEYATNVLPAEQ